MAANEHAVVVLHLPLLLDLVLAEYVVIRVKQLLLPSSLDLQVTRQVDGGGVKARPTCKAEVELRVHGQS